jgi:hypothetical protein
MAGGATAVDALAALGPPPQTRQVGLGPGFIEKDQSCRVEARLPPPPAPAGSCEIGAILFAGAERLFL